MEKHTPTDEIKINSNGSRIFVTAPDPEVIHIIVRPDGDGGTVKREGIINAIAILPTLFDAIEEANKYRVPGKRVVLHRDVHQYEYI